MTDINIVIKEQTQFVNGTSPIQMSFDSIIVCNKKTGMFMKEEFLYHENMILNVRVCSDIRTKTTQYLKVDEFRFMIYQIQISLLSLDFSQLH